MKERNEKDVFSKRKKKKSLIEKLLAIRLMIDGTCVPQTVTII